MSYPSSLDNIATVTTGQLISSSYENSQTNAINALEAAVGVFPARAVCEGRLTLTSATPVTTTDVSGATTVYFTPMGGGRIGLYDGTNWDAITLASEISVALGTVSNNTNYDIFCYSNAGTPTLEILAWTDEITRATNLTLQNGVYVKSGAATRRYLGTFRTTSTTTTEDSAAKRFLWNMYNRVPRILRVTDATTSWTYSTASWRQANNSGTNQVAVVVGLDGPAIHLEVDAVRSNTSATIGASGIGINSTSTLDTNVLSTATANAASGNAASSARYDGFPRLGYSYFAWLEYGSGTGTDTWYGKSGQILSGMTGSIM